MLFRKLILVIVVLLLVITAGGCSNKAGEKPQDIINNSEEVHNDSDFPSDDNEITDDDYEYYYDGGVDQNVDIEDLDYNAYINSDSIRIRTGPSTKSEQLTINGEKAFYLENMDIEVIDYDYDKDRELWYKVVFYIDGIKYAEWVFSKYVSFYNPSDALLFADTIIPDNGNNTPADDEDNQGEDDIVDNEPEYIKIDVLSFAQIEFYGYDGGGKYAFKHIDNNTVMYRDENGLILKYISQNNYQGIQFVMNNKAVAELAFAVSTNDSTLSNGDKFIVAVQDAPFYRNENGIERINELGYDITTARKEFTVSGLCKLVRSADEISKEDAYALASQFIELAPNSSFKDVYFLKAKPETVTNIINLLVVGYDDTELVVIGNVYFNKGVLEVRDHTWNSNDRIDVLTKGAEDYIVATWEHHFFGEWENFVTGATVTIYDWYDVTRIEK